jgi:hypothetical protein
MNHPSKTRETSTNQSPRGVHKNSMMRKEDKKTIEVIIHKHELSLYNQGALAFKYEETLAL